jgi:hypothetical protein
MNELKELTIEELRMVKFQLVGQIQELQAKTRLIDKEMKARLQCSNG